MPCGDPVVRQKSESTFFTGEKTMRFVALILPIAVVIGGCSSNYRPPVPQDVQQNRDKLVALTQVGQDISAFTGFRAAEVIQGTKGAVCYRYPLGRTWFYDQYVVFVNGKVESWASPGDCQELLRQNGYSREVRPGTTANEITIRDR
jgi:hypothetical protein